MSEKRRDSKGRILKTGESQRKDGTYMYRYSMRRGERSCIYAATLSELREREATIQRISFSGLDYSAGQISVSDLLQEHIKQKRNIKKRTRDRYQNVLKLVQSDPIGAMAIRDVRTMDAKRWVQRLQDGGRTDGTVRTIRSVLSEAFDHAAEDDAVRKNPFRFRLKDVLYHTSGKVTPLSKETQIRFFDFILSNNTYRKYYNDFMVLLDTGLRISELYGLTLSDIDFDERVIHVTHQIVEPQWKDEEFQIDPPKSASGVRDIPMRDRAFMALQAIVSMREKLPVEPIIDGYTGFLFVGRNGNPKRPSSLLRTLYRIVDKYNRTHQLQLPHITPHMFRHTFCTELVAEGIDIKTVQYVMGHSTPQISLAVYASADTQSAKAAMLTYSSDGANIHRARNLHHCLHQNPSLFVEKHREK